MIAIKDLSYRYKDASTFALQGVDLIIDDGDFVGIMGTGGSGKSTLTYALNGIIPHYYQGDFYGSVKIDGRDTVDMELTDISLLVGSVCQDIDSQMVATVVEDELLYALENFGFSKTDIEERLRFALREVGISDLRYRAISSLSGGQKQKVAIAAIIALKPRILVLDEPTAELDPISSRQVFELLKELSDSFGITVILVEQKTMLLCEFAKHLVVLNKGEVAIKGTVEDTLRENTLLEELGITVPRVTQLYRVLADSGMVTSEDAICKDVTEAQALIEGILK